VRLAPVPENPIERVVARLNLAPRPLLDTQIAYTLARLVMVGTKLGVFEALREGPLEAYRVADRCGLDGRGTQKLLFALAGAEYVKEKNGRYELTPVARKWLVAHSPHSLADKLLLQFHEWKWIEHAEAYVRTGEPLELHSAISGEEWAIYQRGMRAVAGAAAAEASRRVPVPKDARHLLDIGGSHGYYSVALCRRHEGLSGVVLDLPEAVEHAAPILAAEGMGHRVVHRPGDALTDDLGSRAYDVVLIAQLVHHFSEEQNRALAVRVARALRPGGVYAILDAFRSPSAKDAGQTGALLDFYFALTSQSGTWSPEEMAGWQRAAGLEPKRPIKFRTVPGFGMQAAAARG
jgi:2-polyprenyl-3-methyl-5-hydroxy-6-metoxy-1,4-benzoquinol methylase